MRHFSLVRFPSTGSFTATTIALLLCLSGAASARAASLSIEPRYVQSFGEGLVPLGQLPNDGAATPVGAMLHYEFRMSINNLQVDEDFWTAIFNVDLGPGLEAVVGWMDPGAAQANGLYDPLPSLATYDSNGPTFGGVQSHWQFGNADFGLDPDDLQSIIVEASGPEAANRQYGELSRPGAGSADGLGSPTLIGAILVRRTELVPSFVSVSPIEGNAWGTYQGNSLGIGAFAPQTSTSFSGETSVLLVPEPASFGLALVGMAVACLCRGRRRT